MVGYMSLEEQIDVDFGHARLRAFPRRIPDGLRKGPTPNRLPCFEERGGNVLETEEANSRGRSAAGIRREAHRLPVLRSRETRLLRDRPRSLRLLRASDARLGAGDPTGHSRP